MLVLSLTFPAGRYHGTPWGRHVNEGVPEWPPSPYRLVRALYDSWKRKRPDLPDEEIERLLGQLAVAPPCFRLPPASTAHTRSFLSKNTRVETDRALVFDAFVVVDKQDPVLVAWPSVTLDHEERACLDDLLSTLSYLGRSESWVEARVVDEAAEGQWNCVPEVYASEVEDTETILVACPIPRERYVALGIARKGSQTATWIDAIRWSTDDLFRSKRSDPPALISVPYLRSRTCFDVHYRPARRAQKTLTYGVLFALDAKVPPPVTSTLEIAERVRRRLMGIHRAIVGDPASVSRRFSGKDTDGRPLEGHQHLYLLPLDRDRDGRLDHMLAICRLPLGKSEQIALDRLDRVWQSGRRPHIRFIPVQWGTLEELCPASARFLSATPFIPPHHYRRGRGPLRDWLAAEVRREAHNHGIETPVVGITPVARFCCSSRSIRWIEFTRNRKNQPADLGYGFEIEFAEPVCGPIALGRNSHFGMGLFLPADR